MEQTDDDENFVQMNCQVVPEELIVSSDDESSDDDMNPDELRIFDLINLKVTPPRSHITVTLSVVMTECDYSLMNRVLIFDIIAWPNKDGGKLERIRIKWNKFELNSTNGRINLSLISYSVTILICSNRRAVYF